MFQIFLPWPQDHSSCSGGTNYRHKKELPCLHPQLYLYLQLLFSLYGCSLFYPANPALFLNVEASTLYASIHYEAAPSRYKDQVCK